MGYRPELAREPGDSGKCVLMGQTGITVSGRPAKLTYPNKLSTNTVILYFRQVDKQYI